jgi:hypothetical protein
MDPPPGVEEIEPVSLADAAFQSKVCWIRSTAPCKVSSRTATRGY